ncbi:MAG: hypothetical protein M3N13_05245, partial [Candidatus Eremiobacteraeota bacterium]|nr:hypothetical protein [Candidatus Eremiobacteraeota bacterium]
MAVGDVPVDLTDDFLIEIVRDREDLAGVIIIDVLRDRLNRRNLCIGQVRYLVDRTGRKRTRIGVA